MRRLLNGLVVFSTLFPQACSSSIVLTGHQRRRVPTLAPRPLPACSVMLKVEHRIDGGQLKLRDEELCMKSVKEAANARAVLASYHPLWLRLGMEVVTGQPVTGGSAGGRQLGQTACSCSYSDAKQTSLLYD